MKAPLVRASLVKRRYTKYLALPFLPQKFILHKTACTEERNRGIKVILHNINGFLLGNHGEQMKNPTGIRHSKQYIIHNLLILTLETNCTSSQQHIKVSETVVHPTTLLYRHLYTNTE